MRKMWLSRIAAGICVLCLTASAPAAAADLDLEDILAEFQTTLELSDEQTAQVGVAIQKFAVDMDATMAKHDAMEEPDPQERLSDVKKVRGAYKGELKKILSKEQFAKYEETMESIFKEILGEVAQLQLTELQPALELTDEQVEKLKPVMGDGLFRVVQVLYENGDKRMGVRTKLKIANKLKKVKVDTETAVKGIMTEEQFAAWQAMKEAAKAASEESGKG